jgi:hypothetical protein
VYIVKELIAVPTTEEYHFGAADQVSRVIKSSDWCTTAFRPLIPCHSDGVKRVQVSKHGLLALSAEHDDPSAG